LNANITIGFRNDGHVVAGPIDVRLTVYAVRISDNATQAGGGLCTFVIHALPPNIPNNNVTHNCWVGGFSPEIATLLANMTDTLSVEGMYTYDNGFGERKIGSVCSRYLPQIQTQQSGTEGTDQLIDCDLFPIAKQRMLDHIKAAKH
jgi:hypothetical protein